MKTAVLLCAITAGFAPSASLAGQIFVNNMSDAAVLLTAYDAKTPTKVVGTWCVETGAYIAHELKGETAKLQADVMTHDECKEPLIMNRTLQLRATQSASAAALYRLSGTHGKYSLTGPFAHKVEK
jgi:hypothetical protein